MYMRQMGLIAGPFHHGFNWHGEQVVLWCLTGRYFQPPVPAQEALPPAVGTRLDPPPALKALLPAVGSRLDPLPALDAPPLAVGSRFLSLLLVCRSHLSLAR